MTQVTLYAHDITCDHCIATIKRTTEGVEGVSFVAGDEHARSFVVDFDRAAALDTLGDALAAEGYDIDVREVTMPWGQPMQAAMAVAKGYGHGH